MADVQPPLRPGDLVEYLESGVFDQMIVQGDVGVVTAVANGWVHARWPRTPHEFSVPVEHVRRVEGDGAPYP